MGDAHCQSNSVGALQQLAHVFSLPSLKQNIAQISATCLHARKVLQCCYVLRFHTESLQFSSKAFRRVGELEAVVSALEVASGLRAVEVSLTSSCAKASGSARSPDLPSQALNLKEVLPQLCVVEVAMDALMQLETAVQLQFAQLSQELRQEMQHSQHHSIWQGLRNQIERHARGLASRELDRDNCTVM